MTKKISTLFLFFKENTGNFINENRIYQSEVNTKLIRLFSNLPQNKKSQTITTQPQEIIIGLGCEVYHHLMKWG